MFLSTKSPLMNESAHCYVGFNIGDQSSVDSIGSREFSGRDSLYHGSATKRGKPVSTPHENFRRNIDITNVLSISLCALDLDKLSHQTTPLVRTRVTF